VLLPLEKGEGLGLNHAAATRTPRLVLVFLTFVARWEGGRRGWKGDRKWELTRMELLAFLVTLFSSHELPPSPSSIFGISPHPLLILLLLLVEGHGILKILLLFFYILCGGKEGREKRGEEGRKTSA